MHWAWVFNNIGLDNGNDMVHNQKMIADGLKDENFSFPEYDATMVCIVPFLEPFLHYLPWYRVHIWVHLNTLAS